MVASSKVYVPDRGDVVWVDFDPQTGREQAGRRPALVISPVSYNRASGLAVMCPITNRIKGYPFEVPLPAGLSVTGVVLSDQLKSQDWRTRKVEFICQLAPESLAGVLHRINSLLGPLK